MTLKSCNESSLTSVSRSQVEQSYRRYAPIYDLVFGASLGPGRVAMANLVATLKPLSILEVGVGTGLTLSQYPSNSHITGIDISDEMLAGAAVRISQSDANRIALHKMDAEDMNFEDGQFDCVTVPYVLSVSPNPDRLVKEIRRVCRPNGHIVIVNHFSGQAPWRFLEMLARPLSAWLGFRSDFSIERHVLSHSWTIESIQSTNILSLSKLIHIRNS